ncbi:MAG: flavodoxin family protein [Spirochaetota bacterium]
MSVTRVLGICGSPRKGNSYFLLNHALEGALEVNPEVVITETYTIKGKTFLPCIACSYCAEHEGECIQKDDFEGLRDLWLKADVILYSVPVYHMSIPGQLKCFIDRLGNSLFGTFRSQLPEGRDTLPKMFKIIGSIAQGIHIFSGQEHTITDLINHALIMQSIPVTADLWESYIGVGGWTSNFSERNGFEKLYQRGDVSSGVTVRAARTIGRRAVEMAMIIRAGLTACRDMLKKDPVYHPLLSRFEEKQE